MLLYSVTGDLATAGGEAGTATNTGMVIPAIPRQTKHT